MASTQDDTTEIATALNGALGRIALRRDGKLNPVALIVSLLAMIETYAKPIPRGPRQEMLGRAIARLTEIKDAP